MATYVLDRVTGRLVDKASGEPLVQDPNWVPQVPYIAVDIKPYKSVVSGKMVAGRSQQREDLKRSGCRLVDPSECPVKDDVTNLYENRLKRDVPAGMIA